MSSPTWFTTTYPTAHPERRISFRIAGCRRSKAQRKRNPMRRSDGQRASVMAATPAVVPRARTSFWARVMLRGDGSAGPANMAAKVRKEAMTTRLFRIGANIGTTNRRRAFRSPVAAAPSP